MKKHVSLIFLLIVTIILSVVIYTNTTSISTLFSKNASGTALIGGNFTLEDTQGNVIHDTDFRGKLMLVYFGFTYCPDVCPTGLQTISVALELLGTHNDKVQSLFITLDPERDTPKQMASYLQNFNSRILGLTGTKEQAAQAAASYRVYYNKVAGTNASDYLLDHSAYVYLLDKNGKYLTHFPPSATAEQIAAAINTYL